MLQELAAILSCWELELFIALPALEVIIEKVSVQPGLQYASQPYCST